MLGMGYLIKCLRLEKGLTVRALSQDICSERFLYIVESGKSVPSVEILRFFSDRLGVNIFDYLDYIGYTEPINAKFLVEASRKARLNADLNLLRKLNAQICLGEDSAKLPLKWEYQCNEIALNLYQYGDLKLARRHIEDLLREISKVSIDEILAEGMIRHDVAYVNGLYYLYVCNELERKEGDVDFNLLHTLFKLVEDVGEQSELYPFRILILCHMAHHWIQFENTDNCLEVIREIGGHLKFSRSVYIYYYLMAMYYKKMHLDHHYEENFEKFLAIGQHLEDDKRFKSLYRAMNLDLMRVSINEEKLGLM